MLYVNPIDSRIAGNVAALNGDEAKRTQAFEELGRLFLYTLLQEMRRTVDVGGRNGTSHEQDLYEQMLDDALGGAMVRSGQLPIAQQMEEQFRLGQTQHQLRDESGSLIAGLTGR